MWASENLSKGNRFISEWIGESLSNYISDL
jgi:hypothetical protein